MDRGGKQMSQFGYAKMSALCVGWKRAALAAAQIPPELDVLKRAEWLRKELGDSDDIRRAATLFEGRERVLRKLTNPENKLFTRRGLEQATPLSVARFRAQRIAELCPRSAVFDATCGIGADSLALRAAGLAVQSADLNPEILACCVLNLESENFPSAVTVADALAAPTQAPLMLVDPDRRDSKGQRLLDPESWSPALAPLLELSSRFEGVCIKLPPTFDPEQLSEAAGAPNFGPTHFSWISSEGEIRELCLSLGSLAGPAREQTSTNDTVLREAVVLREQQHWSLTGEPGQAEPLESSQALNTPFVIEPDPAVIRSGLVARLAEHLGAAPMGPRIAFLGLAGSTEALDDPRYQGLYKAWPVVGHCAADRRKVRRMLSEHEISSINIKKRGHPASVEELTRQWKPGKPGKGIRKSALLAVSRLVQGHEAFLLGPAR